jgi:hypothetical protein
VSAKGCAAAAFTDRLIETAKRMEIKHRLAISFSAEVNALERQA